MNKIIVIKEYHNIISLIYNNIYKFKKIYYNKNCKNNRIKKFLYNLKYSKLKIISKSKNYLKKKFKIKKENIIGLLIYKKTLYNIYNLLIKKKKLFIIFLENLTNVNNIMYCVRSSNASAIDCIIFTYKNYKNVNYNFFKNSLGSIIPFIYIKNIKKFLIKLKKNKFNIICTKENSNINLYEINFKNNIIFIFGSENKGIKNILINKICNYNIYIPMKGNIKNLNVSNTCTLCLFEYLRQKYYK